MARPLPTSGSAVHFAPAAPELGALAGDLTGLLAAVRICRPWRIFFAPDAGPFRRELGRTRSVPQCFTTLVFKSGLARPHVADTIFLRCLDFFCGHGAHSSNGTPPST